MADAQQTWWPHGNGADPEHMATQGVSHAQGLGELYEEDYQKAAGFAAEDADEPLRQEVDSGCTALQGLSRSWHLVLHLAMQGVKLECQTRLSAMPLR